MKHVLLLCMLYVTLQTASAQIIVKINNALTNSNGGNALQIKGSLSGIEGAYVDLKAGTPYYQDIWVSSKLITKEGEVCNNISIKLNLMEHSIYYIDNTGKVLVLDTPLSGISFKQPSINKDVYFVNGELLPIPKKGWYQLLINDSISLVKGFKKVLVHHKSYGSPIEYYIETNETYLLYFQNREYEIKKPSDLIDMLPGSKIKLEQHLKKIKNKVSKEEQILILTLFSNELLKSQRQIQL